MEATCCSHCSTFMIEEKVSLLASLVDSFLSASSLSSLRNEITLSCSGREGEGVERIVEWTTTVYVLFLYLAT